MGKPKSPKIIDQAPKAPGEPDGGLEVTVKLKDGGGELLSTDEQRRGFVDWILGNPKPVSREQAIRDYDNDLFVEVGLMTNGNDIPCKVWPATVDVASVRAALVGFPKEADL